MTSATRIPYFFFFLSLPTLPPCGLVVDQSQHSSLAVAISRQNDSRAPRPPMSVIGHAHFVTLCLASALFAAFCVRILFAPELNGITFKESSGERGKW